MEFNQFSELVIIEAKLQAADPPDAVGDAFQNLLRAGEYKNELINQGLPDGHPAPGRRRGAKTLRKAEGYKETVSCP